MMKLSPEVNFSDRARIDALMDYVRELFKEPVARDGTDIYMCGPGAPDVPTVATIMTNMANGELVVVLR